MANIKKTIYKEAKKIVSKTELDITAEELANLALFKFLNLPYFNNVHDFVKMNYNVFDEISIGVPSLNNVKGYSNETIKSFTIQMDKDDKYPDDSEMDNKILTEKELAIFKSFVQIANISKNLNEVIENVKKEENIDPFYSNKIMNIMNSSSYSGNRLIRAVVPYLNYQESDTYTEYQFEQNSKTKHYRSRSEASEIKNFVYDSYSLRSLSTKSFDEIIEIDNLRTIEEMTGVDSLSKDDLKNFHKTHPNEYNKSIFKIFKEMPSSQARCKAVFDLNHYDKEIKVLNTRYKSFLNNDTCEQLMDKYADYIEPIVQTISKMYPQIIKSVQDSPYEIKSFIHKTNKEKSVYLKKEHPLEIFQADYTQLEYRSLRGLLFFKDEYRIDQGFYISANNGLEDIAGAEGYIMDSLSFNSIRINLPNFRINRVYDTGRGIDISVKKDVLEEAVKMAAESKCPFVYDIIERDHKGQDKFNTEMKTCIELLKNQYPNVIFINDCVLLNEKEYLESYVKSTLLAKLIEEKAPYEKMVTANKTLEKYFKTNEFNEISKLDYSERLFNKDIQNKIESILLTDNKNKIKFTP